MTPRVFRDHPGFATTQAAMDATPAERIESIGKFIEKQVARFHRTLKPRERANCGPDDAISELVIKLLEKDSEWNPERGKYITFAGKIIERELCSIREQARVVPSPRNSSGRMREYVAEEIAGTITPRRAKTANDIRRTNSCPASIHNTFRAVNDDFEFQIEDHRTMSPDDAAQDHESIASALDALQIAIKLLPPFEAFVLGRISGLWGTPRKTIPQLSWEIRREENDIRKAFAKAIRLVRLHLTNTGHSVTAA